jgi:hypothetical protein
MTTLELTQQEIDSYFNIIKQKVAGKQWQSYETLKDIAISQDSSFIQKFNECEKHKMDIRKDLHEQFDIYRNEKKHCETSKWYNFWCNVRWALVRMMHFGDEVNEWYPHTYERDITNPVKEKIFDKFKNEVTLIDDHFEKELYELGDETISYHNTIPIINDILVGFFLDPSADKPYEFELEIGGLYTGKYTINQGQFMYALRGTHCIPLKYIKYHEAKLKTDKDAYGKIHIIYANWDDSTKSKLQDGTFTGELKDDSFMVISNMFGLRGSKIIPKDCLILPNCL